MRVAEISTFRLPAVRHRESTSTAPAVPALSELALQRLALLGLRPDPEQALDLGLRPEPEVPPRPRVDVERHAGLDLADDQPDRHALGDGAELRLALGQRPLGGAPLAEVAQVGEKDRGAAALAPDHHDLDREGRAVGAHRVDLDPPAECLRAAAVEVALHAAQVRAPAGAAATISSIIGRPIASSRVVAEGALGRGVELDDDARGRRWRCSSRAPPRAPRAGAARPPRAPPRPPCGR